MKKLYWKMYQDKNSTKYQSVTLTEEQMKTEIEYVFGGDYCEELAPVFEPVMMEEEEFKKLPEFEGF